MMAMGRVFFSCQCSKKIYKKGLACIKSYFLFHSKRDYQDSSFQRLSPCRPSQSANYKENVTLRSEAALLWKKNFSLV